MKTIKHFLVLTLAGLFFVACKDSNATTTETSQKEGEVKKEILAENLQTASFTIDGMHCEFGCAKGIEKKLAKIEGIKSASINFETKEATIEYDGTVHTPQVLADVVKSMDDKYEVSNIKSSSDQSSLYSDTEKNKDKEKSKKDKKAKKSKKGDSTTEASTTTEKPAEKKAGCCSGKSSCGSKSKSGSL